MFVLSLALMFIRLIVYATNDIYSQMNTAVLQIFAHAVGKNVNFDHECISEELNPLHPGQLFE
jgi:hypothetical protein